ncbi:acyl carrier protein [Solihabitans fulvus]|uniref:Acyl carrier protein n=1 Tax=Solihabitans fulvus TaxID=1892852 RepID=A0A5B2XS75_9PSEU|nr:acyl carrier protein [Solihabitans fulvus]KAA2266547.1 acyl carrier protein [Solihabitans fulvus]
MVNQRSTRSETAVDEVVDEIRTFFSSAVGEGVPHPDDDYFALGLVNSLFALELVTHVERTFGLTVEVEDLDLDNFRTMNRIARFVRHKLSETSGGS